MSGLIVSGEWGDWPHVCLATSQYQPLSHTHFEQQLSSVMSVESLFLLSFMVFLAYNNLEVTKNKTPLVSLSRGPSYKRSLIASTKYSFMFDLNISFPGEKWDSRNWGRQKRKYITVRKYVI